jgi:ATP-binding cassette subfamily C protein CydCD
MRPLDRRVVEHLRPAGPALVGLVAANVGTAVVLVAQAFAVAHLVVVLVEGDHRFLPGAALLVAAAFAARAATGWLADVASAGAAERVTTRLRRRLVDAVLALPADEIADRRTGELTLLLTRGVSETEPYLTRYVPALVLATVLPPLTLLALASQDLLAAGIVLVTLPLVPVFAALVGLATRDRADRQWRTLATLSGHFVDVVRGLPTLVVHGRAAAQTRTIRRVADEHRRATVATLRLAFASSAVLELVATLSVALVAVVVGLRLASGDLHLFTALAVLLLAPEAYWPLRRVGAEFHAAAEGTATFERASTLLDRTQDADEVEPVAVPPTGPAAVTLSDVRVRYPGRRTPALLVDDLELPATGLVAVTGPSGCGKSTLLAALAGEVVPERGRVSVAGAVLDERTLGAWRRRTSWVPQRPWVLTGSVRDNLLVARPSATDGELREAMAASGAWELVERLPGGLDAPLAEDGGNLSAGQLARLSIARVFLARRPLVLVDEPSAHLDAASEQALVTSLVRLSRSALVVVVTHAGTVTAAADVQVALTAPDRATDSSRVDAVTSLPTRDVRSLRVDDVVPGAAGEGRRRGRMATAYALGALATICGAALTVTSGWLITRAAEHPPVLYLMVAIVAVRAFGIGRPLLRYVERLVGHDAALRSLAAERARVYDLLVPLTPGALGRRRGDVLAHVVDDVDAVLDSRLRVRGPVVAASAVGVMATVVATVLLPASGVVLVGLVATTVLTTAAVRTGSGRRERHLVELRGRLSAQVHETITSARGLVLWQATDRLTVPLARTSDALAAALRRSAVTVASARAVLVLGVGAGTAVLALVVRPGLVSGSLTGPWAAALLLVPIATSEALLPLVDAAAVAARTSSAQERLDELVTRAPAVAEPERPVRPPTESTGLAVEDVDAGWVPTDPVLRGLEVRLGPGHRLGVVGPSGSGKSTLAALLVRFLDPTSGRIRADGVELAHLSLDDVHRRMVLVDDDPYVFSSTVLENVRLARPDASREDVEAALRAVSLGAWLDDLPAGLDSFLGDGHASVSGGERARLGLARAVLSRPRVLVLDEPTAHLDAVTAREVARDLLRVTHGLGLVWVTHDRIGLEHMDTVLDLGTVPAAGAAPAEVA